MPTLYIPSQLREYAAGQSEVLADGKNVRAALDSIRGDYPELLAQLLDDGNLRPNYAISVDGELRPLGLLARVEPDSEIHFVAALAGG